MNAKIRFNTYFHESTKHTHPSEMFAFPDGVICESGISAQTGIPAALLISRLQIRVHSGVNKWCWELEIFWCFISGSAGLICGLGCVVCVVELIKLPGEIVRSSCAGCISRSISVLHLLVRDGRFCVIVRAERESHFAFFEKRQQLGDFRKKERIGNSSVTIKGIYHELCVRWLKKNNGFFFYYI